MIKFPMFFQDNVHAIRRKRRCHLREARHEGLLDVGATGTGEIGSYREKIVCVRNIR